MINRKKIILNQYRYFTPTWGEASAVEILELISGDRALVRGKPSKDNKKPLRSFIRPLRYLYNSYEAAYNDYHNWERYERKRKAEKKSKEKEA